MINQNHSEVGNLVCTPIPEALMRSIAMEVFAMPKVMIELKTYDGITSAVDRHSGYFVAVSGKKTKKKETKDKHRVDLIAKTVVQAMIRHWLTIFDVLAVICSNGGSQFVSARFKSMCKRIGFYDP